MFKVGQKVTKNDVFLAGWFFESFSSQMTDVTFVNEDNTLCVLFSNSDVGVINEYVCKELI